MGFKKDLTGEKFGYWTVLNFAHNKFNKTYWNCKCKCGTIKICAAGDLCNGSSLSCGCYRLEQLKKKLITHGHTINGAPSKEFITWAHMLARCNKTKSSKYFKYYAGKGVKVCARWLKFENFLKDMGKAPSKKHSLDRFPNKNGDYKLSNCRWATTKQQMRNTTTNKLITWKGKTQCISAWEEELGMRKCLIQERLKKLGWPIEKAFTTPIQNKRTKAKTP